MKYIVYKRNGAWFLTDKVNHEARVQDARKIIKFQDMETLEEVVDYIDKHYKNTNFVVEES